MNAITLKDLNPALRYGILPKEPYDLRVPQGTGPVLSARVDTLPLSSPPRPAYVYHKIRPGESLSTIARKYRTNVSRIARANNIRRNHFIVAGKTLKIPLSGTRVVTRAPSPPPTCTPDDQNTVTHRVKRGDSLWIIARRYGTTTKKIQALNGLKSTNLYIGQRLEVQVPEYHYTKPATTTGTNQYYVRRGDSPYKIARRHNMSLGHFLRINDLTPRSKIFPGQVLKVE